MDGDTCLKLELEVTDVGRRREWLIDPAASSRCGLQPSQGESDVAAS